MCTFFHLGLGLMLACLPSGTDATASASQYMTQPSGIPILSPVLFMHVGDPYIHPFFCIIMHRPCMSPDICFYALLFRRPRGEKYRKKLCMDLRRKL